jgi:biopolymer transport protein TolR
MAGRAQRSVGAVGFGGSAMPGVTGMEGRGVTSAINVTPMVDVMLVLLIIFMVITPILTAYEAELPQAQYVVPEPDDDVVTLGINAQGVLYIGDQAIPPEHLAAELRRIYSSRPDDHLLYLKADRKVGYHVVLTAIDAARSAGVRTIGAITEPMKEEEAHTAGVAPASRAGLAAAHHGRR